MDYQFLSQTMLFSGESPEEIKEMLSCLGAAVSYTHLTLPTKLEV